MTMTNVYGLIEKINDVLNQMIGLEGERFEAMRVDLLDVREGLYVIEQHQSEIDNYDNYIEDLERNLQRTAPWIFNQYIDPEDLLDFSDEDSDDS